MTNIPIKFEDGVAGRTTTPGAGEIGEVISGGFFSGTTTSARSVYETLDTITISAGTWLIVASGNGVINSPATGTTLSDIRLRDTTNSVTLSTNNGCALRTNPASQEDSARYGFSMQAPINVTGTTNISVEHEASGTAATGTITTDRKSVV